MVSCIDFRYDKINMVYQRGTSVHFNLGDIIQENFVDSYNNLTLKTVLMLKWTNRNCAGKGSY